MSHRLREHVAIITGASKGLAAAIAKQFGVEGARVVVNYASTKGAADGVVNEIVKAGGNAIAIKANVSDSAEFEQLFAQTNQAYGRVDVLVNNAGSCDFQPIENLSLDFFRKRFHLNVFGNLLAMKEAVKYMPKGSSIINTNSTVTYFGPKNASVYSATKGAIDGLTRALSNEIAPRKIRVNAIKPVVVGTDCVQAGGFLESEFGRATTAKTPLPRFGVR
ncbi:SDR family NAD(P)-dependent oxidoreductase [Pseudomonas tolaasii]